MLDCTVTTPKSFVKGFDAPPLGVLAGPTLSRVHAIPGSHAPFPTPALKAVGAATLPMPEGIEALPVLGFIPLAEVLSPE